MSRRYEYIWRSARENVAGLPPLPDDLNESQYAHLLFDASCYICKRKGCENILWTFRARVCHKCATSLEHNEKYLSRQPLEYRNLGILPSEYVQIGRERILVGSNRYARKFETEFQLMKTEYEREEWVTQKQKELEAIQEHAILCIQWRESTLSNRTQELDALQKERKQNIIARLSTLGWGREALLMDKKYQSNFSDHRLVKQPKALTDRDWKRMRGELLNLLSRHRQYRQRKEWSDSLVETLCLCCQIYIGIRDTLDPRQPLPAIGDVLISMNLSTTSINTSRPSPMYPQ
ncbi:hypothetical protein BDP27DRAFT_441885 [Rhodocollybia butyracea]|uniref:Uncharacterized protein n=1 Tax=Rhodocollybia butyracea TaxID=206335 RepID=A0A9P5PZX9_9AGAR|nr:hypothetical protein BDP27DRAFT_441885 [Rhodocollybia butyracea]